MRLRKLSFLLLILVLVSCNKKETKPIEFTLIQINDVYEIAPIAGGNYGGMARVANLKKTLQKENPNTWMVLSGDFLNPSIYGTLKYEGKRIRGKQMVETMNSAQVDFVTFGNHEFDIEEDELLERINESRFEWIATNTFYNKDSITQAFFKDQDGKKIPFPKHKIVEIKGKEGAVAKMGLLGITLPYNQQPFVHYDHFIKATQETYNAIKDQCDFVIAITHLTIDQDKELAAKMPQIPLLMGGHEHNNMLVSVGKSVITKADANAKTAYIHRLVFNPKDKSLKIDSELKEITPELGDEETTAQVVQKWMDIADVSFRELGFDVAASLQPLAEPLDAREVTLRYEQVNMGEMITAAMEKSLGEVDAVLLGSGSVRIDDIVSGHITQYDVLRMLPFGGSVVQVDMKGEILTELLDAGEKNKGLGGYLQRRYAERDSTDTQWLIRGETISDEKVYKIGLNDYIMTGLEANMAFMKADNPLIVKVHKPDSTSSLYDIRKVVIDYLSEKGE